MPRYDGIKMKTVFNVQLVSSSIELRNEIHVVDLLETSNPSTNT